MLGILQGLVMPIFSGKAARARGPAGLRPLCLVALIALVIQFVLGIILNLYVTVPDYSRASYIQEIERAPGFLTAHALVGLVLLGTAVLLLIQAIALQALALITLLVTGLAALLGAFVAGEVFVKNGADTASLWMSILTGVALASYIGVQALAGGVSRTPAGRARPGPPAPHPAAKHSAPSQPGHLRPGLDTGD
jgi:hypothetical protein